MPNQLRTSGEALKLLERYSGLVYRVAYSVCRNRQDAEDIMQEVFLSCAKRMSPFESEEHEKAWLIRVTVNRSRSLFRSFWRKNVLACEEIVRVEQPFDTDLRDSVVSCVLKLKQKQRVVIYLKYYEDLSIREISRLTGWNESTVKSHLMRAKSALKDMLCGEFE